MALTRLITTLFLMLQTQSFNSDGAESDFFPFGEDVGDTCNLAVTDYSLDLSTPVIFYRSPYLNLMIKSTGLVSFEKDFTRPYFSGISIPYSLTDNAPFVAPFWSAFQMHGSVCFRQTNDSSLLQRFVEEGGSNDTVLTGFQPLLLVVVTWTDPVRNVSFQVAVATDGVNSFSRYFYGYLNPDINYIVGFNEGDGQGGAILGGTEANLTRVTEEGNMASSIYRIDGHCVSLLQASCPLPFISVNCTDSLAAVTCDCRPGMENRNGICADINECLTATSCPPGNICINTVGSFTCHCRSGFYGSSVIHACIDADECLIDIDDCDSNAICNNTEGSYNCTCRNGFIGDGITCIQEGVVSNCTEGGENCVCVDTGNGRTCYCSPGYKITDAKTCQDINECADNTDNSAPCNSVSVCINTPGSYQCACFPGFTTGPDGITCSDIDECAGSLHNCHNNADCINTNGSFTCRCALGYNGNGTDCFAEAVCSPGTHSCQICTPVLGNSFVCLCPPGFSLGSNGYSCHDVNECATLIDNCHRSANCSNTNGSFSCSCMDGFYGDGVTCIDIDECATGQVDCGIRTCLNTLGNFTCVCPENLTYDATRDTCGPFNAPRIKLIPVNRPIREHIYGIGNNFCLEGNNDDLVTLTLICEQDLPLAFPQPTTTWNYLTINGTTRFRHVLPSDDLNIPVEFNETRLTFGPLRLEYFNINGNSVTCQKKNGVVNTLRTIFRICGSTECDLGVSNNCTVDCTRNGSHHQCLCNQGYELGPDQATCLDINECNGNATCDVNTTTCRNKNGTYECQCHPGFKSPPETGSEISTFCEDIDECKSNISGCNQICNNSVGSFNCLCEPGFNLSTDGITCSDVDECSQHTDNCGSNLRCINTNGSFACVCHNGYKFNFDFNNCTDINECSMVESNECDLETTYCNNTIGSYECICLSGYRSQMNRTLICTDINECDDETLCDGKMCRNTNGSYDCIPVCNLLQELNGVKCSVSAASVGGLLAGIIVLILIVMAVIVALLCRFQRGSKHKPYEHDSVMHMDTITNPHVDITSKIPEDIRINRSAIEFRNDNIAHGEFGLVYKATYSNEIVAVKTPKNFNSDDMDSFFEEIQKMLKIRKHDNVLNLIGITTSKDNSSIGIVMPYMWHGSLDKHLRQNKDEFLIMESSDSAQVVSIMTKLLDYCLQIAKGMAHLIGEGIIHRDLAARNCMLNLKNQVKISDFGLSLSFQEDETYVRLTDLSKEKLPWKWLAMECFTEYKFSEASDVWSYGITCWEIFSAGRNPYPDTSNRDLQEYLKGGNRMDKPNNLACNEEIYEMTMKCCWHEEASQRPSFVVLSHQINQFLMDKKSYLPLC